MKKGKQSKTRQGRRKSQPRANLRRKNPRSLEVFLNGKRKNVEAAGGKLEGVLKSLGYTKENALVTVNGRLCLSSSRIPTKNDTRIDVYGVGSSG